MARFIAAKKTLWVILFLSLHGLIVILWLGMMFSPHWVKMDSGASGYDFEGSLSKVTDSDNPVFSEEEDYPRISDYYCDWKDSMAEDDSLYEVTQATCTMFAVLSFCCCFFWTLEVIA